MTIQKTLVTAEDLLRLPGDLRCELLDGEVVELAPAGLRHNVVLGRLTYLLLSYVDGLDLGVVSSGDTGIVLARNPDRVRAPDICFIAGSGCPQAACRKGSSRWCLT